MPGRSTLSLRRLLQVLFSRVILLFKVNMPDAAACTFNSFLMLDYVRVVSFHIIIIIIIIIITRVCLFCVVYSMASTEMPLFNKRTTGGVNHAWLFLYKYD